jgi:hypothetical protein
MVGRLSPLLPQPRGRAKRHRNSRRDGYRAKPRGEHPRQHALPMPPESGASDFFRLTAEALRHRGIVADTLEVSRRLA